MTSRDVTTVSCDSHMISLYRRRLERCLLYLTGNIRRTLESCEETTNVAGYNGRILQILAITYCCKPYKYSLSCLQSSLSSALTACSNTLSLSLSLSCLQSSLSSALTACSNTLSTLHHELSTPNIQGNSNFKVYSYCCTVHTQWDLHNTIPPHYVEIWRLKRCSEQ